MSTDLDKAAGNETNDERKFLHDISSPIGTALFLLDAIVEMSETQPLTQDELAQLKTAFNSLLKVKEMLHNRRSLLVSKQQS